MANIMVNEACNLSCPYCFAEEFVNKSPKEMTLEDFHTALNFVLSDEDDRQVGIIGGEPTLYTHINEALRMALSDTRTQLVTLFTNAVELDRLEPEILKAKKFRMLVNCNSPEDMGDRAFEKMRRNLTLFSTEHFGEGRSRLSVNIYKPDFDYSYVLTLLEENYYDVIRLSISVPQHGELRGKTPPAYFNEMKPTAIRFIGDMIRSGILTGFDCNFIPACVFTSDERDGLQGAKEVFRSALSERFSRDFWDRVIFCDINNCSPVIDILPDLRAIRCFGLSEYSKRDIRDFRNITALRNHYVNEIDRPAINLYTDDTCSDCYSRETGQCSGGCLLFKAKDLFSPDDKTV